MRDRDSPPSPRIAGRARTKASLYRKSVPAARCCSIAFSGRTLSVHGYELRRTRYIGTLSPLSAALQLAGIKDLTGTRGTSTLRAFATISCWILDILLHGTRRLFMQCAAAISRRTRRPYVTVCLQYVLERFPALSGAPEGFSARQRAALTALRHFMVTPRLVKLARSASYLHQGRVRRRVRVVERLGGPRNAQTEPRARGLGGE
ncbi:hypothetical protein FB451DRAFT_1408449 [Mycena latifolia]|nr:hypothetical protein FB451DRAFT_1408449 [Mycena latifolia]